MPIHTENFELKRQIADLHAELAACKQRTHTEYMRGVHDGRMQCGDCEQLAELNKDFNELFDECEEYKETLLAVTRQRDIAVDILQNECVKWAGDGVISSVLASVLVKIQQSKGEV